MLSHTLKLLALLPAVAIIAPASAGQLAWNDPARSDCPYERAELVAAGYDALPLPLAVAGYPGEGSLFDPGRRAAFLP